jgi:hypothetical protein
VSQISMLGTEILPPGLSRSWYGMGIFPTGDRISFRMAGSIGQTILAGLQEFILIPGCQSGRGLKQFP